MGTGGSPGTGGGQATITYRNIPLTAYADGTNVGVNGGPVSTGSGIGTVTLNPLTGVVTVTGTFTGLTGAATAAHIHGPATAGVNAGVIVGPFAIVNAAGDVGSGTFSGSGTLSTTGVDGGQSLVAAMEAGLTYVNVHTAAFGGGEIRGQIQ